MKHLLLTGADGFLGKNFLKTLSGNYSVYSFEGDIRKPQELDNFIKKINHLDFTYHFAGISSPTKCNEDKSLAFQVNVFGAKNVYQSIANKFPNSTFVFPSTGQVYAPNFSSDKMDESFPINPVSYYAETKLEAEEALKKEQSSIHLLILRLFNHTHKSQDPSFFLPSLYHQILKGMSQIKTGNLDLERDFAAVQDLTSALNTIIQSKMTSSGIFNICSGIGKNLKVLAAELAKQLDKNVTWSVDENLIRKNEPHTIVGSSVKFQEQFNWQPKYSSNEHELIKNFLKEL